MAEDQPTGELAPREPTLEDLRNLCRELNLRGAKYAVIGGFAIRAANYIRATMDIDLLFADPENEEKVYSAFPSFPTTPRASLRRVSWRSMASFAWRTRSSWTS